VNRSPACAVIATLASCVLAGCIPPPARVDTPRTEALDKSYSIELPTGWVRQYTDERNLVASRDGFTVEAIAVVRRPLAKAFPRTKKAAAESMLPSELAELEIAELKARDELTSALRVLDNEPAQVSGREGFRLKVSYNTVRGLEIYELVYGVLDGAAMYRIVYRAPRLYYFQRYYADFVKTVESFTLLEPGKQTRPHPADARRFVSR
jgi:hypothetical protein